VQVITGLSAIATSDVAPLSVKFLEDSLTDGTDSALHIVLTDVFGKFATDATVTLTSATLGGKSTSAIPSSAFTQSKSGTWCCCCCCFWWWWWLSRVVAVVGRGVGSGGKGKRAGVGEGVGRVL
jgi:hypothetical protein